MSERRKHAAAAHIDQVQALASDIENLHVTKPSKFNRSTATAWGRSLERGTSHNPSSIQGQAHRSR